MQDKGSGTNLERIGLMEALKDIGTNNVSLSPMLPRIHLLSTFSRVLLHLYTHTLRREVLSTAKVQH